ncbi:hypothetical protein DFJ63DRAFT_317223 [Scheffersomyces coipomensis]|uniref:uncharacterized protein n=1 Tax=Scheffersomyces coipomensis TaxID=1788519 RepID=UPI00315D9C0A
MSGQEVNGKDDAGFNKLDGNVVSIPLSIITKQGELIKSTKLYLHIRKSSILNHDDPTFTNISITGVYEDGSFHTDVTESNIKEIFNKVSSESEQRSIINKLFPLDSDQEIEQQEEEEADKDPETIEKKLVMDVKIVTLSKYYDEESKNLIEEDNDPNQSPITINIRTQSRIPILVGSIKLEPINFEDDDHEEEIKDESVLFNWIDVLLKNYQDVRDQLIEKNKIIEDLKNQNYELTNDYKSSKFENKEIIDDLQNKFYQVLNSKKDKIWQLLQERKAEPGGNGKFTALNQLSDLNENLKPDMLYDLDKSKIADKVDDKYISPKKRGRSAVKTENGSPTKKRKPTIRGKKKSKKDEYHEATDNDEDYSFLDKIKKEANNSFGNSPILSPDSTEVNIKQEPNSLELRDDDTYIEESDDNGKNSSLSKPAGRTKSSLGFADREIVDNVLDDEDDDENDENDEFEENRNKGKDEGYDSYNPSEEEEEEQMEEQEKELDEEQRQNDEISESYKSSNEVVEDSLAGVGSIKSNISQNEELETDYGSSDQEEPDKKDQNNENEKKAIDISQKEVETDYSSDED